MMLRLSAKGRYGTRVMLDLARNSDGGYILLKDIAKRQNISLKYLEQVVQLLKSADLVKSARGAHGGYKLAKGPSEITLEQILQALEGDLSIVKCIDSPKVCNRVDFCVTRNIWKKIKEKVANMLSFTTLEDILLKEQPFDAEQLEEDCLIYHI